MKNRSTRLCATAGLLGLVLFSGLIPQTVRHASAQGVMHAPPYKIVLSNSFIGNTWRVEMENEFKAACAMPPLKRW